MLNALFIVMFLYILMNITQFNTSSDDVDKLIKDTHKYSGIHEESYGKFYANMRLAMDYKSANFLYKAIGHLNEIPLYASQIDPDIQAELAELGQKIAVAFELVLAKKAMNDKQTFIPKYI